MEPSEVTSTGDSNFRSSSSHGEPNLNTGRKRWKPRDSSTVPRTTNVRSTTSVGQHAPRRNQRPPRGIRDNQSSESGSIPISEAPATTSNQDSTRPPPQKRDIKRKNLSRLPNTGEAISTSTSVQENPDGKGQPSDRPRLGGGGARRGAKFNAGLTDPDPPPSSTSKPTEKYRSTHKHSQDPDTLDDLTSRLTHALRTPPYPDCPICFSPIHPAQPMWSCSPSIPVIRTDDAESDAQEYCWTPFHVKCIGSWATKSVKDIAAAWRARGEECRRGDWRCPGCQAKREIIPSGYWYVYYAKFQAYGPTNTVSQVLL
jgi:transcriptional repressor NF-X1